MKKATERQNAKVIHKDVHSFQKVAKVSKLVPQKTPACLKKAFS
jgi:hypothetical protein